MVNLTTQLMALMVLNEFSFIKIKVCRALVLFDQNHYSECDRLCNDTHKDNACIAHKSKLGEVLLQFNWKGYKEYLNVTKHQESMPGPAQADN